MIQWRSWKWSAWWLNVPGMLTYCYIAAERQSTDILRLFIWNVKIFHTALGVNNSDEPAYRFLHFRYTFAYGTRRCKNRRKCISARCISSTWEEYGAREALSVKLNKMWVIYTFWWLFEFCLNCTTFFFILNYKNDVFDSKLFPMTTSQGRGLFVFLLLVFNNISRESLT